MESLLREEESAMSVRLVVRGRTGVRADGYLWVVLTTL